jgi:hypothetical protein
MLAATFKAQGDKAQREWLEGPPSLDRRLQSVRQ